MSSSAPAPATVLEVFDALDSPGTPLTTPEVAEEFDCVNRTIYNKLDALVDEGSLETKKVGARGRVWWRPPGVREHGDGHDSEFTLDDTTEHNEMERLQEEQKRLVELIASGAPLEECLSSLCTAVSSLDPTVRASIVLTDDQQQSFQRCIAPDLAPSWREGLEGLSSDDRQIGTCGEAVYRGEPVTCENVETDERWSEEWGELCLANDVLAGHSAPIRDEDGEPLGSFMLCFDEPRTPNEWQQLAEFGIHVARIALERERSNRVLRESEERLHLATDVAEMGVWELDLQTNESLDRSPRYDEIFGYDERDEWSLETFLDHVHPDDRKQVEASFEDAFETREWTFDCRIIRADDEQRWISAQGEFYDDDEAEPVRAVGTVEDITERKERERELERARDLLAKTERIADVGGWEIDTESKEVFWTDHIFNLLEFPDDEEPPPDEALDVYHEADRPVVEDAVEAALDSGEPFDVDVRYQPASGDLRWVRVQGEPKTVDNEVMALRGAVQDISERKRTQEQLTSLKNRLLETSPTGILVVDPAGEITLANERTAEILGMQTKELTGLSHDAPEFELVDTNGEAISDAQLPFERAKQGDDAVFGMELGTTGADSERVWLSVNAAPLRDDAGKLTEVVVTLEDITERKRREEELRQSEERFRGLVDATSDVVYRMSTEWDEMRELTGEEFLSDTENPSEDWVDEYIHPDDQPRVTDAIDEAIRTKQPLELEHRVRQADGRLGWTLSRAVPLLGDDGEIMEWFGSAKDITKRKQAEAALEHVNDASRELMDADEDDIFDSAATLMQTVLDVEYSELWCYDSDTGELHQQAESADSPERDDIRYPDEFDARAWQTFVSEDRDVSNDLSPHPDITPAETPLRSVVIVPLGRYGVLCAGSTRPNEFDDTAIDLAETVAANVKAGLDRADREGALETRTDELTRLDRLNSIIRKIDQALVQADTHAEINRVVCEQLADSDLYEFAWIGEHDAVADSIDPQEWAGVDSGYIDDLTITTDETSTGHGPVGTAVRTRETQVVADIATDARFGPWREQTLAQGVRSCISIPLVYEDALYGVLTVYAGTLNTDEKDRAVLDELGETIAHAINAIESKETLHSDSVVELTLGLQPSNSILGRLAQHAGCRIEFEGFVPQADDVSDVFFTAHETTPDEIRAAAENSIAVEALTWITDREDGCLFKARLSGSILPSLLVEQDAMIRTLTFESDNVTVVVDIPSTATVREFVEAIQTTHPDTELLTRRTRERAIQTPHGFKTAVEDGLTARQQEILRTAYLSGFFESPRESTGQEIAGLLDVSQTTFTHHLRAGQHNLLELLFDEA